MSNNPPNRQFININSPDDTRSRRYVWNVRSHASRSSRSPARISRAENQERRNRDRAAQAQAQRQNTESDSSPGDFSEAVGSPVESSATRPRALSQQSAVSRGRQPRTPVAEGTASLPTGAVLPQRLVDLIESLSEASPWLGSGVMPGVQSRQELMERHPWPEFVDEPALYLAQLLSAVELVNRTYGQLLIGHVANLSLRVSALRAINSVLGHAEMAHRDATLAAVVQMTLHEYKFGEGDTYAMHMQGLRNMVELRGGLGTIRNPPLAQAARFALSVPASEVPRSAQFEDDFQHAITIQSALLTFVNGSSDLPLWLFNAHFQTSRHAALLVSSQYGTGNDDFARLEDPRTLLQEVEGAGHLAWPEEQEEGNDREHVLRLVAECTRLALAATLQRILHRAGLESPGQQQVEARAAQLQRLDTQRLLGTQYAFVFAWAHFAVNGAWVYEGGGDGPPLG